MCNFFQKGIQRLKIQQIIGLGMHFVIHLYGIKSKTERELKARKVRHSIPKHSNLSLSNLQFWRMCPKIHCAKYMLIHS